jgi:hypothetical protein
MTATVPATLTPQSTPAPSPQPKVWLAVFFQILLILLGLVLLLCIGLGAILVMWWWLEWRNLDGYSAIMQVYARTERYLTHLMRIPFYNNETPKERHKRIIGLLPKRAERSLRAIVNLYQAERYGNQRHPRWEYHSLEAWKALRELILWRWLRDRLPLLKLWWKE